VSAARDPVRSLTSIATATLLLEAFVLLLALVGLYGLHHDVRAVPMAGILALAAGCTVVAFLQRRPLGIALAFGLQALVVAAGLWLWPLFALGVVYAGLEAGYLRLRRGLPATAHWSPDAGGGNSG
jgi:hypothetical protein